MRKGARRQGADRYAYEDVIILYAYFGDNPRAYVWYQTTNKPNISGFQMRAEKTSRRPFATQEAGVPPLLHGRRHWDALDEQKRAELTKLEEMLQESERLAQIGRLSASIAHEIKNPLEAIADVLHLLEAKAASDEQRKYIAIGQTEVKRAVDIANQTLDFARNSGN